LRASRIAGTVINTSFFEWAVDRSPEFDAVIGNPPFVRYQFIPKRDRDNLESMIALEGKSLARVSNLWIPFTIISLELLRHGGAFALVLPSELLAIKSAGLIRSEFIRHFSGLQIDLFPRGVFEGILQDVMVVSGRRDLATTCSRPVTFREHRRAGVREWTHQIDDSKGSWTRYLLTHKEVAAVDAAYKLQEIHRLGDIATIGVSTVTGANGFFTVDDETLSEFDLQPWARPLLARTAESRGIVFRSSDHKLARKIGKRSWILDFSDELPDPMKFTKPSSYLQMGVDSELPERYKCRIRSPWYRVPDIRTGCLMLSKRAHQSHRLILNRADVHTTDTIYRGQLKRPFESWKHALVAGFHNSLTILSTELEGRTYGGGVLELVPSEIAELSVPLVNTQKYLQTLDKTSRAAGGQADADDTLINATDEILCSLLPGFEAVLPDLRTARTRLRNRRFFG
jgi:adenine-specific DNA methylase